ncbi:uncharacterized protein LOC131160224 [Malania oleifera]|uniref:uncharacterized protein LOC131160224 n=1 Tax=Malania oleifera TaxID=397392 RepID=UPI0025AEC50F|nr:uncharacterized protein LOC131160224 [Malania oleifera]
MESNGRRRKNTSGDVFSFPSMSARDQQNFEFEFGWATPAGSPSYDPAKDSPADHLFYNGRLLPHAFPATNVASEYLRAASRASSASSRDSLTWSRSNSGSNSRSSSSCSSARTSSSDNSDRKVWSAQRKLSGKTPITRDRYLQAINNGKPVLVQAYGPYQKWQFIAPAPVLKPEVSRRKNKSVQVSPEELRPKKQPEKKKKKKKSGGNGWSLGFGRKFLQSFVSACRECHSMEPSIKVKIIQ